MKTRLLAGLLACLVSAGVWAADLVAPYQCGYAVEPCAKFLEASGKPSKLDAPIPWWAHVEASFSAWNLLGDGPGAQVGSGEDWLARAKGVHQICTEHPDWTFGAATLELYMRQLQAAVGNDEGAAPEALDEWRLLLAPGGDVQF